MPGDATQIGELAATVHSAIESSGIAARRWLIAYSGGLDSTVLLHLMAVQSGIRGKLLALHVDHALQAGSAHWRLHCKKQCEVLDVAFDSVRLDPAKFRGEGPEDSARRARYEWIESVMRPGDCLLLAHHLDDQAETVFLNLFRGSGVSGLAAMPKRRRFGPGQLLRPMLGIRRDVIHAYAKNHGLCWIDDPTNMHDRFDRNRIRHQVLPVVTQRWPKVRESVGRLASNMAETRELCQALASIDHDQAIDHEAFRLVGAQPLQIHRLRSLSCARRNNLLRHWIFEASGQMLSSGRLQRLIDQLVMREDATTRFEIGAHECRRYRSSLYMFSQLEAGEPSPMSWDGRAPLELPDLGLTLVLENPKEVMIPELWIEFGGLSRTVRLKGREGARTLRKVFQQQGVPPWWRRRLPQVTVGSEIIALPGLPKLSIGPENEAYEALEFGFSGCDQH